MHRRIFSAIFGLCFATLACAQSSYRIVYNEATASFVPLFRAVYQELGITPVFELLPSERAISEVNAGHVDADLVRVEGVEKNYPNLILTREAVRKTELYAYVRKGSAAQARTPEEWLLRPLGYTRGSKLAEDFLQDRGLHAISANSADVMFRMLAAERFDLALVTSTQLLASNGVQLEGATRVGPVLSSSYSYHVLHRSRAELAPKIDAVLKAMKADGRFQKILNNGDTSLKP